MNRLCLTDHAGVASHLARSKAKGVDRETYRGQLIMSQIGARFATIVSGVQPSQTMTQAVRQHIRAPLEGNGRAFDTRGDLTRLFDWLREHPDSCHLNNRAAMPCELQCDLNKNEKLCCAAWDGPQPGGCRTKTDALIAFEKLKVYFENGVRLD